MGDRTRELIRELVALSREQATCTLAIESAAGSCAIHLVKGKLVSVTEDTPGEPLGRLLVRKRLLTREQYREVLERMTAALALGEELRFGEVAIEMGYLTVGQLGAALAEQVRWRAIRVIQRGEVSWERRETGKRNTANDLAPMHLEALALDAVRWVDDAQKEKIALAAAWEGALQAQWSLVDIDGRFELSANEASFVRTAIAGDRTVADCLGLKVEDDVDPHAILTALLAAGAVAPRDLQEDADEPAPTSLRPPSRPQPAPPKWATIDARKVRGAMAKVNLVKMDAKAQAAAIERRRPTTKVRVDRLLAEQNLQRGKDSMRDGDIAEALVDLNEAHKLEPESKEIALYLAWAKALEVGDPLVGDMSAIEQAAVLAARENPNNAFAHYVLGEVLKVKGNEGLSKRHIRHALRLEPGIVDNEQAIRAARGSQPSLADIEPRILMGDALSDSVLAKIPSVQPEPSVVKQLPPSLPPQARTPSSPDLDETPLAPSAEVTPVEPPVGETPSQPAVPEARPSSPFARTEATPSDPNLQETPAKPASVAPSSPDMAAAAPAASAEGKPTVTALASASAPQKPSSRGAWVALVLGLVCAAGAAAYLLVGPGKHRTETPPTAEPTAAATAEPSATPSGTPSAPSTEGTNVAADDAGTASADAGGARDAGPADAAVDAQPAVATASDLDDSHGALLLPAKAKGHRVFVDGHFEAEGKPRLVLKCGARKVKIGSHGKEKKVAVPCGGEISLE